MTRQKELNAAAMNAQSLDAADPLQSFRSAFSFPQRADGGDTLYFCGNSLGLMHQSVKDAVNQVIEAWQDLAVEGHFVGERRWMTYHELLQHGQAQLLGARHSEVVTMNTLTVNLHLAMISFYRPHGRRCQVLMEKQSFPSDRYAVESQIRLHGLDPADCLVELEPPAGARIIDESQIESYLQRHGDRVALILWPGVQYASGQVFDLPRIGEAGRRAGAAVGFDLAHAIGNVPLALHDSECDFAIWCTYKYLNAGPGSVAGMFVHERHAGRTNLPRFHGWYGNARASRFKMAPEFDPAAGADAWQLSNPPILSMAPLLASLQVFADAGFDRLRKKSLAMTAWLAGRIQSELGAILEIVTPLEPQRRGCQLSLRVRAGREQGRRLFEHLERSGVLPDWREPDVIRVAPVPLYNSYQDCDQLVRIMADYAATN